MSIHLMLTGSLCILPVRSIAIFGGGVGKKCFSIKQPFKKDPRQVMPSGLKKIAEVMESLITDIDKKRQRNIRDKKDVKMPS